MPKQAERAVYRRPGSKFWQIRWTDATGREVRRSSGTESYEEACAQLAKLKEGSGVVFQRAVTEFLDRSRFRPSTKRAYAWAFKHWLSVVAYDALIEKIGAKQVQKFVADRLRVVAQATVRMELCALGSLFRFAERSLGCEINRKPLDLELRDLDRGQKRVRWLTLSETEKLFANLKTPMHRLIVLMAMETGMRKREILDLTLDNLDWQNKRIRLEGSRTKSGKGRFVPLPDGVVRALDTHIKTVPGPYVFPSPETGRPYQDIYTWWHPAIRRAGVDNFRFHDLRHHFATTYTERGGDLYRLSRLMGHYSVTMTERYAHLHDPHVEAEFRRIMEK